MIHSNLTVSHSMLTRVPFVEAGTFGFRIFVLEANKIHQMSRCDTWGWSRGPGHSGESDAV